MNKTLRITLKWIALVLAVCLQLFIIIFTPMLNEWLLENVKNKGMVLAFVVVVPFLVSVIFAQLAWILNLEYTLEKAERHLERQLNSGLITMENYKLQMKHLHEQNLEKKKFMVDLETTKTQAKQDALERLKNGIEKETNNNNFN